MIGESKNLDLKERISIVGNQFKKNGLAYDASYVEEVARLAEGVSEEGIKQVIDLVELLSKQAKKGHKLTAHLYVAFGFLLGSLFSAVWIIMFCR